MPTFTQTFCTGATMGYAGSTQTYRTRSIPGPLSSAVYFERDYDLSPPIDDEIIIATLKVRSRFRKLSLEEGAALPSRPKNRNFISRLNTRLGNPNNSDPTYNSAPGSGRDRFVVYKLPRKDYKKFFARDREGKYAGTEPEKEWDEEELEREFGGYQGMALRSVPGGAREFGEGKGKGRDGGGGGAVGVGEGVEKRGEQALWVEKKDGKTDDEMWWV